jgi:hypothetical protein
MHMFRHRELSQANIQRFAVRSVEDVHDEVPRKEYIENIHPV